MGACAFDESRPRPRVQVRGALHPITPRGETGGSGRGLPSKSPRQIPAVFSVCGEDRLGQPAHQSRRLSDGGPDHYPPTRRKRGTLHEVRERSRASVCVSGHDFRFSPATGRIPRRPICCDGPKAEISVVTQPGSALAPRAAIAARQSGKLHSHTGLTARILIRRERHDWLGPPGTHLDRRPLRPPEKKRQKSATYADVRLCSGSVLQSAATTGA